MEELVFNPYSSYGEYKELLDRELKTNAESFVRIGYMLKVARDTNVLADSGYKTVADFAQAEYGLTKDIVSRYIAINDRYSENGYSEQLKAQYTDFGVAKLQEMLTLPDSIIAEIEPTLTRKEIQEIKKEIAEEEKITPLEVIAEAAEPQNVRDESAFTFKQRVWKAYFHEAKEEYRLITKRVLAAPFPNTSELVNLVDVLAPSGAATKFARIPGIGKIMISFKGDDQPITMTNTRDGSKESTTIEAIYNDMLVIFDDFTIKKWESVYGEEFEPKPEPKEEPKPEPKPEPKEKPEVAPVQQTETDDIMPAPGSWSYTTNPIEGTEEEAAEEKAAEEKAAEEEAITVEFTEKEAVSSLASEEQPQISEEEPKTSEDQKEDEQIPGQMEITDYEEAIPKVEAEEVEELVEIKAEGTEVDEQRLIMQMLECIQMARRTLAAHVEPDAEKISEMELDAVIDNARQLISKASTIKTGRKVNE